MAFSKPFFLIVDLHT